MSKIKKDTSGSDYTERLHRLEHKRWKDILDVQRPYRWNLKRLRLGKTLDIGCGIGRNLKHLPKDSVGVDHNKHSIDIVNSAGLKGFVTKNFTKSKYAKRESFDSMLLAHVIEHMNVKDGEKIIKYYLPYVRKGGQIVIICPQKKGFASDSTHVTFYNRQKISELMTNLGLKVTKQQSFPFTEKVGDIFTYNEYVVVGQKN